MPGTNPKPGLAETRNLSTPKIPVQVRSIDRVDRILDAAESLIETNGISGVTMQKISQESGVGRASVYQFFPSILAIWKGLALRYLAALKLHFEEHVTHQKYESWQDAWDALIDEALSFYDQNPIAQNILLGSDGTQDLRMADPDYDMRFAEWISEEFSYLVEDDRALSPEYLRVNVTATTSLFSLSVWEHGHITPFYRDQIKRITIAYNQQLLTDYKNGVID
jgi:AcrR family transcriptional regulator